MNHDEDHDLDELDALRREAESEGYRVGLEMLRNPATPPTARASVVRAFLAAGAARPSEADPEPHQMTFAEIMKAAESAQRRLDRQSAEPAQILELKAEPSGVFD